MTATVVYEDEWGAMIDYPDDDYVEIRWYDATARMDKEMFQPITKLVWSTRQG